VSLVLKIKLRTQLNPQERLLSSGIGQKSGVSFTGLPKIGNLF
jgi:hypothetical protein